jgi:hypothetical protein
LLEQSGSWPIQYYITIYKYGLAMASSSVMGTTCENCDKLASSLIEFNSVLLCPECFDKEIERLSSAIVEP